MSKVLILYNSVGLGHKVIGENIGNALSRVGFEVKLHNILEVQGNWLSKLTTRFHHFVNNYQPYIWRWLYTSPWFTKVSLPLRIKVAAKNYRRTLNIIEQEKPDVIISTHTVSSAVVAFLKQKGLYKGLFGIAFSDYHFHPYWHYEEADFYLVNIEEQKQALVSLGVDAKKVFVCGITLKPKSEIDIHQVKEGLGIGVDPKVILIAAGSLGWGMEDEIFERLSSIENAKLIVVCGQNEKIQIKLSKKLKDVNALVLGFYKPMEELYAISDVFLTKAGGLSVAEGLQWGLPIIVTHCLPGQEELNLRYLQNKGLVEIAKKDIALQVRRLADSKRSVPTDLVSDGNPVVEALKVVIGD
jgi:processive 1,2-diacylglycerol beta-glucosyltransferase